MRWVKSSVNAPHEPLSTDANRVQRDRPAPSVHSAHRDRPRHDQAADAPSSMPPTSSAEQWRRPAGTRAALRPSPSSASLAVPALAHHEDHPQRDDGHECPDPALQDPFGDERPADEGERRPDELHDFNFVTARVGGQADDVGDGQARRQSPSRATITRPIVRRKLHGGSESAEPAPVVADVRDAGHRRQPAARSSTLAAASLRDPASAGPRSRPGNGLRSSRSAAAARSGKSSRKRWRRRRPSTGACRSCGQAALRQSPASIAFNWSLLTSSLQEHRHLGRLAPPADDLLQVAVDHQEEAEHEEARGDGQDRERRRTPAPRSRLRSLRSGNT